jgi:hypothetical protein
VDIALWEVFDRLADFFTRRMNYRTMGEKKKMLVRAPPEGRQRAVRGPLEGR